jgi:hypothetical protein
MALTLEAEQRLEDANLLDFFENDTDRWRVLARSAHEFAEKNFPKDSEIRPDDVAKTFTEYQLSI